MSSNGESKDNGGSEKPTEEQPEARKAPTLVFGISIAMLSDGSLSVKKLEGSREVSVYDVEYLIMRADREQLVQKTAATVVARQLSTAQQMRMAALMQQAEEYRKSQQKG